MFKREWLITRRSKGQWAQPIAFFILATAILPMSQGQRLTQLPLLSCSLLWMTTLLASLLTLDGVLRSDHQEGCFEQWILGSYPLWWLMLIKSWAHWVIWVLPMVLISPLLMIMLQIPVSAIPILFISLLLGTPSFSFLGLLSTSLTLSIKASGLLLALILIPLAYPVILMGLAPTTRSLEGFGVGGNFALLAAFSIVMSVLAPHVCAFGVKVSI
ncbi:MAG TPA: heme exporter protein CcmB [Gammaproteobacteria bacterium]|nr:heme exporter protein CcmB [Gammaproteobacteria bacterium]